MPATNDTTTPRLLDAEERAPAPRWALAWLAALIVLTLAARLVHPTPWLGSDDASYHAAAEHVLAGETITRVHHHYGRLSVILAVATSMALFGNDVPAVELPTLLASILTVVLVVFIGRMAANWWIGLFAGSIVAVLPYFRVLSTTAYPDVHACFWATLAVTLMMHALRTVHDRRAVLAAASAGVALGLAVSAKIFTVWALVGLLAVAWGDSRANEPRRRSAVLSMFAGGVALFIIHGLAYAWLAGDFWYKWHAITAAQGQANLFPASADPLAVGPLRFAMQRLGFFFEPGASGWGWLAVAFWPAALLVLAADRRMSPFALWAIAGYLLVAFLPVSFRHGLRPYPSFVGRNILFLCVPFALCLAAATQRLIATRFRLARSHAGWPVWMLSIVAVSYAVPDDLSTFRDRPTSRIGVAITRLIQDDTLDEAAEIHMTPSMYWRFRVLFPPELRERLRVSTQGNAPDWWRDTTIDIVARHVTGAPPADAVLLATPLQLAGDAERWDYGVGLEPAALAVWHRAANLGVVDCGRMTPVLRLAAPDEGRGPLLVLRRIDRAPLERKAERTHDADMG